MRIKSAGEAAIRAAVFCILFLVPIAAQAQQDSLVVTFKEVMTRDSTFRGITAHFPHYILSLITVENADSGSVHNLADTTRWLRPQEKAENGTVVDSIWGTIIEHHLGYPDRPEDSNVKHITPDYMVTELYDVAGYGLSAALVMDYSGSLNNDIYVSEAAARTFIDYMTVNDSIAIIKFTGKVNVYQDFTNDKTLLYNAISRNAEDRNYTAVYDAAYTALVAHEKQSSRAGRRAVVVFTDGADNYSIHSLHNVISKARDEKIAVYSIGLGNKIDSLSLKMMADSTGGFFKHARTVDELKDIYRLVVEKIKGYYLLATPTTDSLYNGTWRVIDVTLEDKNISGRGKGRYFVPYVPVDVSVTKRVETPLAPVVTGGDTTWYIAAEDTVEYTITVTNNHPYATAADITVTDLFADSLQIVKFDSQPTNSTVNSYSWLISRLAAGDSKQFKYLATVDTLKVISLLPLENKVAISCPTDTFSFNNFDTCLVYYTPPNPANISITKWALTENQEVINGHSESFVAENDTFTVFVKVTNEGELPGYNISIVDVLPHEYITYLDESNEIVQNGDSLIWQIAAVPGHKGSLTFTYRCRTDKYLPYLDYSPLVNTVTASWAGNSGQKNVSVKDTVWCKGTPPPDPLVFVNPPLIEPYDSVTVTVWTPAAVIDWDLKVVPEDTSFTVYNYWQNFINVHTIPPKQNLQVIPDFSKTQMVTDKLKEEMIVVLKVQYRDYVGHPLRYATAKFEIQSDNEFFLDDNIWHPKKTGDLGMRFKISNTRDVSIKIYDVSGAFIVDVLDERRLGGQNTTSWDGKDKNNRDVGSGIYVAIMTSGNFQKHRKFILVR